MDGLYAKSTARRASLPAALLFLLATSCEDVRRFAGDWAGPISSDPAHQQGFGAGALLRAHVDAAARDAIAMTIDLPVVSGALPFLPIRGASSDALAETRIDGDPLRTYFGFVQPPGEAAYLGVVSLFTDDRIDVRIIRGPDETYGVFSLRRVRP